jgi:hypothetical protein
MLIGMTALGVALSILVPTPAAAQDSAPPPDPVAIDVVTVGGSGCHGTSTVVVSPDRTAFTINYSTFIAQAGNGVPSVEFRKNCVANLRVHVPPGYGYTIDQADYRGFAHIEPGASALQRASYYFQGSTVTRFFEHVFRGPYDDDWQITDVIQPWDLPPPPCGEQRNLNISTELRVNLGISDRKLVSFIAMDESSGNVTSTFRFAWHRCP